MPLYALTVTFQRTRAFPGGTQISTQRHIGYRAGACLTEAEARAVYFATARAAIPMDYVADECDVTCIEIFAEHCVDARGEKGLIDEVLTAREARTMRVELIACGAVSEPPVIRVQGSRPEWMREIYYCASNAVPELAVAGAYGQYEMSKARFVERYHPSVLYLTHRNEGMTPKCTTQQRDDCGTYAYITAGIAGLVDGRIVHCDVP